MSISSISGINSSGTYSLEAEIADILIKYKTTADQALLYAAQAGDLNAVQKLISYNANTQGEISRVGVRYSVLDLACFSGNTDLVKYLIESHHFPVSGKSFLQALLNGDGSGFGVIDYLMSRGCVLPEEILSTYLISTQNSTVTDHDLNVVLYLSKLGIKYFPEQFCSMTATGELSYWRAEWLFMNAFNPVSISNPARDIVELLLPQGLKCNLRDDLFFSLNIDGKKVFYSTPLLMAIAKNDVALVKSLLAGGANPNRAGREKFSQTWNDCYEKTGTVLSPCDLAVKLGRKDILVLLIQHGANIKN